MEIKAYENQYYENLKEECLKSGTLFVDAVFPTEQKSIYRYNPIKGVTIANWIRPFDLVDNPDFIIGDIAARDLFQGDIADCWFISGTAAVADVSHEHIRFVVPENQTFDRTAGYCGIFHFRFWKCGQWYDVVVDDRLPVNHFGKLTFCSNKKDPNEFWGSLLEKAYAKLVSCFEFMDFGCPEDAIVNMTGGVSESIDIIYSLKQKSKNSLWNQLYRAFKMGSPGNASVPAEQGDKPETKRLDGLVSDHSYAIRKLVEINNSHQYFNCFTDGNQSSTNFCLVKLRNPWGNEDEWNGAWSDSSPEWSNLNDSIKNELGLIKELDGEFWMNFDDFLQTFRFIQLVHVNPNAYIGDTELPSTSIDVNWKCNEFHGETIDPQRHFWKNPQYLFHVKNANGPKTSLIASLTCKNSIREMKMGYTGFIQMEIHLYRVIEEETANEHKSKTLKYKFYELEVLKSDGINTPAQEFTNRYELDDGYYVVMVISQFGDNLCKYYLRLFTENNDSEINDAIELKNEANDDGFLEGGDTDEDESRHTVKYRDERWRLSK